VQPWSEEFMSSLASAEHYRAVATGIRLESRAFIDGAYVLPSGPEFQNVNPATGNAINAVRSCTPDDVDRAVAAARRAFDDGAWSRAAPEHRKEVLLKLAGLVRENAEELAVMESIDSGK